MRAKRNMWLFIAGTAVLVAGLGGLALATDDFDWWGLYGTPTNAWSSSLNWCQVAGIPDTTTENAIIHLEGVFSCLNPAATCILDLTGSTDVATVDIEGSAPSKMKLHVRDGALSPTVLLLGDYAELDLDDDLIVDDDGTTLVSGSAWADIATGATLDLQKVVINSTNASLTLSGGGAFKIQSLTVDADTANQPRHFALGGAPAVLIGQPTVSITRIRSHPSDSTKRARLWIKEDSSITLESHTTGNCDYDISFAGGDSFDTRAVVDLDGNFDVQCGAGNFDIVGYVAVDVDGASLRAGRVSVIGRLKVVGSDGGQFTSRQNLCQLGCDYPDDCEVDCENCPTCPDCPPVCD